MWVKGRAENKKQQKDAVEYKTTLIFKKFSLAEEICKEPCLQCPRPPRI